MSVWTAVWPTVWGGDTFVADVGRTLTVTAEDRRSAATVEGRTVTVDVEDRTVEVT